VMPSLFLGVTAPGIPKSAGSIIGVRRLRQESGVDFIE
jgi:hypothetical protein